MNYDQVNEKYNRDSDFRQLVDFLTHQAETLRMSPGEMREAAVFAEIRFQMMKPASSLFYPDRAHEINAEIMKRNKKEM